MPAALGRRRLVFLVTCALALLVVGVAAAGNGGIAPPAPASPNADRIRDSYWLILGFTGAVFVLVESALVVVLVRFRGRAARARSRARRSTARRGSS